MKNLIVAYSGGRIIGDKGRLPWQGLMPADMRHFRELTSGHAVIMGRRTQESLKGPLPNRHNIVVSRSLMCLAGFDIARDLAEAYELAERSAETFVIGGAQLYQAALPEVDRLYVTEIDAQLTGDARFPIDYDSEGWVVVEREEHQPDDSNRYPYAYIRYERSRDA